MSLQKRKCQKGFEHTGRSIQAVCLQPDCTLDRLLCFYCIHESHPNHSIAYLISGLKSPLEMLNKNSQASNPQKHMKYIERRFNKINNGWLRISDNLQQGITRIEERMIPQFNVIRQTFKKNSVDQIIKELTSSEITHDKIEEYVEMINMVKKYKFNDIKKLKFMAFIIEHKLSRIFLNANNKIKEIMNGVIQETNQMNFLNFNIEELIKDRALYLQISKNLGFYQIKDIELNSQSFGEILIAKASSVINDRNYGIIIEESHEHFISIQSDQCSASQIIVERKLIDDNHHEQDNFQAKNEQIEKAPQEQFSSMQLQSQNNVIDLIEQEENEQSSQLQNLKNEKIEQIDESQSENYSNGFRSYKYSLHPESYEPKSEEIEEKRDQNQFEQNQSLGNYLPSNHENISEQGQLQKEEQIKNVNEQKEKEHIEEQQAHIDEPISQMEHDKNLKEKEMKQYQVHLNQFEYESYELQHQSFNESYIANEQSHNLRQNFYNEPQMLDSHLQKPQSEHKNLGENQNQFNQEQDQMQHSNISDQRQQIENQNTNQNNEMSSFKELSEFSCQFPSIKEGQHSENDDSESNRHYESVLYENQTEDQIIRPSYQFSLTITRDQMTLSNQIDLKQHKQFVDSPTAQTQKRQFFNENNQFQDVFGLKNEEKDDRKSKQYELLKKYFIFYNEQAQEQSSQQLRPAPPKRVKWAEEHLKEKEKTVENLLKKKVKLSDSQASGVEIMNFLPRTRSEKMKMLKILEESSPQSKHTDKRKPSLKQKKPSIDQREENQHESNQDQKSEQSSEAINNQIIEYEDEVEVIHEKEDQEDSSESMKIQNTKELQLVQQENLSENSDQDAKEDQNQVKEEKQKKRIVENNQNSKIQVQKHQKHPKPNTILNTHTQHITSTYPHSVKLDKHALAQVSHSLLNKYELAFMKEENNLKKQNNEETQENKIRIKTVYLNGRFHEQIKKRLSLIDEDFIQELTIYCDTMDCAINEDSVALICKMTKLTKLCIYWTYKLPKVLTKKLISSLPFLEELVLCELQDLDTDIANQLVNKLPNLKRLHYASDYMRNLDKMEENLEFLIDFVGTSTKLAPLFTLSKLKNLETFWVSDIDDVKQVKEILSKMRTLKQVSISAFEKRNKDLNSIFYVLSKRNTLTSLSLQGLEFKQESLVAIIRNNPNLNTLIINECPTVSNNTLASVADTCKDLQQLFLMLTDSLQGERIFELKKLRTLVVRACWSINVMRFREGIKKLKNLKYLSLNMNNYWLGDDMLPSIAALPNLIFLNLDTTKVTDKGMHYLTELKNLNTLICGRTEITSQGLYKFLQKTKSTIKKLGLSRESNQELNRPEKIHKHDVIYTEFEGKYLVKIGELLPELTHLSIGGFKNLYIENFATLDNLKCLEYKLQSLPEETEKFLETTRLNLNANY